jgi:flagellar protein FliL
MLRKLLPTLLAVSGLGIGLGAGFFLRAGNDAAAGAVVFVEGDAAGGQGGKPGTEAQSERSTAAMEDLAGLSSEPNNAKNGNNGEKSVEYVRFSNQFVIPIVEQGHVASMVMLALSLEVAQGQTDRVHEFEPKLRDAFLQIMQTPVVFRTNSPMVQRWNPCGQHCVKPLSAPTVPMPRMC